MVWRAQILIFLLLLGVPAHALPDGCQITPLMSILFSQIEGNRFNTTRGLAQYVADFSDSFAKDLTSLKPEDVFLDLGCGQANAGVDFVKLFPNNGKYVGVTYTLRKPVLDSERYSVLKGHFFEDIPDIRLPKAKLITDLYGVYAYSPQIDVVLEKSLRHLQKDGSMYIHLGHYNELNMGSFKTASGEVLNFTQWLQSIPGIKVEVQKSRAVSTLYQRMVYEAQAGSSEEALAAIKRLVPSLKITIIDPSKIIIPKVKLVRSTSVSYSPVPIRHYEETLEYISTPTTH